MDRSAVLANVVTHLFSYSQIHLMTKALRLLRIAYHLSALTSSTFVELVKIGSVNPCLYFQPCLIKDSNLVPFYLNQAFPGQLV